MQSDIERIREFNTVYEQHYDELKAAWLKLGSDITAGISNDPSLTFYLELQKNWQLEFQEINTVIELQQIGESLKGNIFYAFLAGYMVNNNWITQKLSSDINLIFGDRLVADIKTIKGHTKCRGTAFGVAFVAVTVQGRLFAKKRTVHPL